jgi:uncharacterized protein YkwD
MWKIHNIATWLIIAWSVIWFAWKEVSWQNTNTTKTEQVKTNTAKELIWIEEYDYQKMLYMDISLLSAEVVKKIMFEKINEIRIQYWLKKLIYDNRLHDAAYNFAKEKNWTKRRDEEYPHNNSKWWWTYRRIQEDYPNLWKDILFIRKDNKLYWIKENIVSSNNSVYEQIQALMESKWHKEAILSPDINSVNFWFEKWFSLIIQLYANLKQ